MSLQRIVGLNIPETQQHEIIHDNCSTVVNPSLDILGIEKDGREQEVVSECLIVDI